LPEDAAKVMREVNLPMQDWTDLIAFIPVIFN
jgi:hypothetical protein